MRLTYASYLSNFSNLWREIVSVHHCRSPSKHIFYPVACFPLAAYFFCLSCSFAASLNCWSKVLRDMPLITPTFIPHLLCCHPFIRSALFHHCFWAHYSTFSWTELHLPFIRYFWARGDHMIQYFLDFIVPCYVLCSHGLLVCLNLALNTIIGSNLYE